MQKKHQNSEEPSFDMRHGPVVIIDAVGKITCAPFWCAPLFLLNQRLKTLVAGGVPVELWAKASISPVFERSSDEKTGGSAAGRLADCPQIHRHKAC